jgi:hypothetical protein
MNTDFTEANGGNKAASAAKRYRTQETEGAIFEF